MISGWPRLLCSSSPSTRMKMSLMPPALEVVSTWIGRDGQSCASAGAPTSAAASQTDKARPRHCSAWPTLSRRLNRHEGGNSSSLDDDDLQIFARHHHGAVSGDVEPADEGGEIGDERGLTVGRK